MRGYRSFIDSSNFLDINIGFIVGSPGDSHVSTGFTTSHGYPFNRWLYVGGGTGFVYNLNWKDPGLGNYNTNSRYVIPIFAEVRFDAKWHRFTPYLSTQIGGNVAERGGIYLSPTVGYRFNWVRKSAINFGLVLLCLVYCIGNIPGCHVNPAVSFAMLLSGRMKFGEFCGYVVAQLIGAAIGAGFLYWFVNMTPDFDFVGITVDNCSVNPVRSFGPALWSRPHGLISGLWSSVRS